MSKLAKTVSVIILDKEYHVACQPGEEEALMAAAMHLNERMQEVRRSGKIIGTERIAVMVALNMSHELLEAKAQEAGPDAGLEYRMKNLQDQVEVALNQVNQLELSAKTG